VKIGQIIREKQPEVYKKINKRCCNLKKERKPEHLSFNFYKSLMEEGPVYRRKKGGAYRQVRYR
jgi:hypothetical protein